MQHGYGCRIQAVAMALFAVPLRSGSNLCNEATVVAAAAVTNAMTV